MKKNNYYLLDTVGRVKVVALAGDYIGYIVQNTSSVDNNAPVEYEHKDVFDELLILDLGPNPEYSPDEPNRPF